MPSSKTGVLVIGSGAREHALAWKLQQSPSVDHVFIAPGNGSTDFDIPKSVDVNDASSIRSFCVARGISLVVVGPENPLCKGLVDEIEAGNADGKEILVFGPPKAGAQLEGSKKFSKQFMKEHGLPTADFEDFKSVNEAKAFIERVNWPSYVLKADGLAAGKGVIIVDGVAEAKNVAERMLGGEFGAASAEIVIEEKLEGYEVSALCFTDGKTISRMPFSQDHKPLLEGDRGPNTGGMGVIAPLVLPSNVEAEIDQILKNTIAALAKSNIPYKGCLYAGFMVTPKGCKLLEFNVRFGDPETEVIMPLLDSDLYTICAACCRGTLSSVQVNWKSENVVGIVLASEGYPVKPIVGRKVEGVPEHSSETVVFHAGTKRTEQGLVTSGGRVFCVVSIGNSFQEARSHALAVSEQVKFEGKYYRKDIGHFLFSRGNVSYSASGVDIAEGNALVASIKDVCLSTRTPGTDSIGGFGALVDLEKEGFKKPQLVIGMDGVGTKIAVAEATGLYDNLGYDLVGMCVNDVLCHCARPVAFLDYYVTGHLVKEEAASVIRSVAKACKESGCALVGGETAEMPGVYHKGQWDVAGCCIGAREKSWPMLPLTESVTPGDVLLALPSNGLHSNGFSLVRKIVSDNGVSYKDPAPWNPLVSIGEELLRPTKLYVKSVLGVLKSGKVKAIAHITGGGITENLPRVFPPHVAAEIECGSWSIPEVFDWLHSNGPVSPPEMLKTFNCGVGLILVVDPKNQESVTDSLLSNGESAIYKIGSCIKKTAKDEVVYKNLENTFKYRFVKSKAKKVNVGILISGAGSNMKKLIEKSLFPKSNCSVRVVISNKADAGGIAIARSYGIETVVVPSVGEREEYEAIMTKELEKRGIDLICLAGFMRILTASFVNRWEGRIINIHPSLLPSFKGAHAVQLALEAKVKIAGCTAHVVDVEVDSGAIIAQEAVPVYDNDTEETLHERIKVKEHAVFAEAMELMAQKLLEKSA
ncbi:hypothetical protein L596_010361 [Steinernema carpocapsae]|uniref:Trifunctional purine biosynthetic protein adenosine-3 n=1 Tax=Steinernema carpocapsae TaxID=34508 RepID=A0A4U5PIN4_STECR|nr:hypothetical protein L596_010361 [Steinernema carpocapsae]